MTLLEYQDKLVQTYPCGFDEVLIDAQSYGEFVKSILAAYEKERNV